ncbi:MAG: hypothetical protein JSV36_19005 [Anaerolineae bacterium]|nr:MAG: hypothetical protein JSV36_19005 [Anaerolineae bacterium]
MSELNSDSTQAPTSSAKKRGNTAIVVAIIAATVVMLTCIAAFTVIAYVFLTNAPW